MRATNQQGMVLLVSLMLLLLLTMIAIGASGMSAVQLRLSSNSEQRSMAFQAAEAGIAEWTAAYFSTEIEDQNLPSEGAVGEARFTVDQAKSRWGVMCGGTSISQGSGAPRMDCFDLVVEGHSACEGSTCAFTTVHRQGGVRRGEIQ